MMRVPLLTLVLAATAPLAVAQAPDNFEGSQATVVFDSGALDASKMAAFARLVDNGVRDVRAHLTLHVQGVRLHTGRVTFYVSRRVGMSRAYRHRVLLPLARVRDGRAPYLHEIAHILVPGQNREVWLSEGFASYIEAYVVENIGGQPGNVFSAAGNVGIDADARRHLATARGRTALAYVGRHGTPPGFYEDRERVAAPLYVLAHSFFKYIVDEAGLACAVRLLQAPRAAIALEQATGRSLESWKTAWLDAIAGR